MRFVSFLVAFSLVFSPVSALAQQRIDGGTTPVKPNFTPIGGSDGTTDRGAKFDPNGILRVAEEYPPWLQTTNVTLASFGTPVPVFRACVQIGNAVTFNPYQRSVLVVRRTASGTTVDKLYLYLFGSDDNTNFQPVMVRKSGVASQLPSIWTGADTTAMDTAKVQLPSSPATLYYRFPIPPGFYPGRYLAVYAIRDSTSGTTQSLGLGYEAVSQ